MDNQSKLGKFLKDSISSIFKRKTSEKESKSSDWSNVDETVVIKKEEYNSLQLDLFDKTQIIKKLKTKDESNKTIISDYERSLVTLKYKEDKESGKSNNENNLFWNSQKMENEIEKLNNNKLMLKR